MLFILLKAHSHCNLKNIIEFFPEIFLVRINCKYIALNNDIQIVTVFFNTSATCIYLVMYTNILKYAKSTTSCLTSLLIKSKNALTILKL